MSERREGRPYYIDFRETGGVVYSEPTRMLPEIVFTGRTRPQLDTEVEAHTKMVQETLGVSAHKGRWLGTTVQIARPAFLDLSLPSPGFIEIKDNFYTGWFYTTENGQLYAAFRGRDNFDQSKHVRSVKRRPYFDLSKEEAEFWNDRVNKSPLNVGEMDVLFEAPDLKAHNYYQNLSRINLKDLIYEVISATDGFWTTFETFDRNDKSDAKREFLRDNLLNLEILNLAHGNSYRVAEAEVRESMKKSEITVFPLGQKRCAVRYFAGDPRNKQGAIVRTLPLPHNLMKYFQRYGRLGERPMTKAEFEAQYRALVDPNTRLQF